MCHRLSNNKTNWSKCITSPNFKLLPLRYVQVLLASDDLTITEEIIWEACIIWSKHQFEKKNSVKVVELTSSESPPPPPSTEDNKMDMDETTTDPERSKRGVKTPLSIDEDKSESNQSNPSIPSLKKPRTEQKTDYRQYLRLLLPYIRFPLMDGVFFTSKVLPLQILPLSSSIPLVQFFTHPSLPDKEVLDKVTLAKSRGAKSVIIRKVSQRFGEKLPNPIPIIVNKGHSTFLKGSMSGKQAVASVHWKV